MEKVLLIDPRDNVVTALDPVSEGEKLSVATPDGVVELTARQSIKMGHKLALRTIAKGSPVYKYGAAIGDATADILPGDHVHSHNLAGYRGRE